VLFKSVLINIRATSVCEVEMAIEKLKRHTSPSIEQIQAEMVKAEGRTIYSVIHKLINSSWSKEELYERWKQSFYLLVRRVIKHCNY
jgi:hypothetical protein